MQKKSLRGRTITLKLKTDKFVQTTRAKTRTDFVNKAEDIYRTASKMLLKELE